MAVIIFQLMAVKRTLFGHEVPLTVGWSGFVLKEWIMRNLLQSQLAGKRGGEGCQITHNEYLLA